MQLRSVKKIKQLKNQTVLLRVDYNVSLGKNGKVDPWEEHRIDATLPTIEYLLKRGARVVLMTHLGRPEGKVVEKLRLKPVAKRLRKLLNKELGIRNQGFKNHNSSFIIHDSKTRKDLHAVFSGYEIVPHCIFLLENLRFDAREERDDPKFSKALASLGNVYVNDAFAVSHRKNASVHAITKYLPSYAGLLMEKEVEALAHIIKTPRRPLVVVMGGAKVSSKIGLIKKFVRHADAVLLGGGISNTFFAALGQNIGKSLFEPHMIREARALLRSKKIFLPIDVVRANGQILDVGPETRKLYAGIIVHARSIVWNGPLGLIEQKKFSHGTEAIIEAVIKNKSAHTVIGGGETITAYQQYVSRFTFHVPRSHVFLSTGGGAMLEFLEKGTLPGIQPLITKI